MVHFLTCNLHVTCVKFHGRVFRWCRSPYTIALTPRHRIQHNNTINEERNKKTKARAYARIHTTNWRYYNYTWAFLVLTKQFHPREHCRSHDRAQIPQLKCRCGAAFIIHTQKRPCSRLCALHHSTIVHTVHDDSSRLAQLTECMFVCMCCDAITFFLLFIAIFISVNAFKIVAIILSVGDIMVRTAQCVQQFSVYRCPAQ